jgi:aspartyl-tRNA(Asn)/glutamyl-tRNA(Gln) amidotransferase subunit A
VRTLISDDFRAAWERFDFMRHGRPRPSVASSSGEETGRTPLAMYLNDFCKVPMSLAGIPSILVPSGLSDGLPVGFQLVGPRVQRERAARRPPMRSSGRSRSSRATSGGTAGELLPSR